MKKVLFVIALGVFAACGGGAASDAKTDSTKTDSSAMAPMAPAVDSAKLKMEADSTMKADSIAKKMVADSLAKASKGKKK